MTETLCIALFATAHLIRDGWPPLGYTNRGARPLGGLLCILGGTIAGGIDGALLGLAVLVGFWTDQKHAEGQNARGWRDAGYLALSGVTSLAPLAAAMAWLNPGFAIVALVGLAKPLIWIAAWKLNPARWWAWAEPTRIAAMVFGAVIGAAIVLQQGVLGALP